MDAKEHVIGQVLTEQFRYEIPAYQRPYSWQVEQTQDLLQDIAEAVENADDEYFIGSLITIEKQKNELYEVVDGQQRLTTLSLIFAGLRDQTTNPAVQLDINQRLRPRNAYTDLAESPRLLLRSKDRSFFLQHVLDSQPLSANEFAELDGPKKNIVQNLLAIKAFLSSRDEEWLKKFGNYILKSVFVVFVKTESFDSAYRLFKVLNTRGLDLANADVIKNELFGKVGEDNSERLLVEELWMELEEIIESISTASEEASLDTFLGYHRVTLVPEKARKSLADEYRDLIEPASVSARAFVSALVKSARNYSRIRSLEVTSPTGKRSLAALQRVSYDEWIPALLAFLNSGAQGISEADFIVLLEKITMQNWVRRLGRTKRNTIYYQLISALNRDESPDALRAIFTDSANNEEFVTLLRADVYGTPSAKAILLRLEEGDQDDSVTKTFAGTMSIEHVLPQALKDPYWSSRFTPESHQEWVHKLGNLTPLSGAKNSSAQYAAFPKKIEVYKKRGEKVSFDLTKAVCEEPDWTVDTIKIRQDSLIALAEHLWRI